MNALLISGTEMAAGATLLTKALAAYWQTYCTSKRLGIFRLVQFEERKTQTGSQSDYDFFNRTLNLGQSAEEFNPLSFETLLDPPTAAEREGRKIKLDKVWQAFELLCQQRDFVLMEGHGGLGTPITRETTVADLAWDWRIPCVLVVPVKLGAIAHTVANVALANQAKVHLKGIILNCVSPCSEQEIADWVPVGLLQSLVQKPILGCIPYLAETEDIAKLAQVASNLDLERLLPLTA